MHQEFDPRDLEPTLPAKSDSPVRSKVAPIMIALVALAGFGGVVWYAYDQGVRQTAPTTTPLIKADTSPTKVRPEQPGGMEVPHQDKLVLNTLADGKPGAPSVERLLPPPETPLPRPAPDAAPASQAPSAALPPKIGPAPAPAAAPAVMPPVLAQAPTPAPAPAAPAAAPPAPTPTATQTAAAPTALAPPPPAAPAPKPAAAPAATPKAAPAATAPGGPGFKVQLVSVKEQDKTGQEWARLQRAYPELAPLHMSVVRVDLGDKGVWYRIYGGPLSDAASAGHLCDSLKAKNQGCVVVKP